MPHFTSLPLVSRERKWEDNLAWKPRGERSGIARAEVTGHAWGNGTVPVGGRAAVASNRYENRMRSNFEFFVFTWGGIPVVFICAKWSFPEMSLLKEHFYQLFFLIKFKQLSQSTSNRPISVSYSSFAFSMTRYDGANSVHRCFHEVRYYNDEILCENKENLIVKNKMTSFLRGQFSKKLKFHLGGRGSRIPKTDCVVNLLWSLSKNTAPFKVTVFILGALKEIKPADDAMEQ